MDNELKGAILEAENAISGLEYYERDNPQYVKAIKILQDCAQRVLDAEEALPKRIIPDNCDKHDKCNAWTCPRCASFHSFNDALDQAAIVIAKNYRKVSELPSHSCSTCKHCHSTIYACYWREEIAMSDDKSPCLNYEVEEVKQP
jgi:hypothetical protein